MAVRYKIHGRIAMSKSNGIKGFYRKYISGKPYMPIDPYDGFMKALSTIPEFSGKPGNKKRDPKQNRPLILRKLSESWITQQIWRPIISEVMRPGLEIQSKFKLICDTCDTEFTVKELDDDKCTECGGTNLRKPDYNHRKMLKEIIGSPNRSNTKFRNMIKSQVYYNLALDEFYTSIAFAPMYIEGLEGSAVAAVPREVYVENPAYIKPLMNERGIFNAEKYACPLCDPDNDTDGKQIVSDKPGLCPKCNTLLKRVHYVQEIATKIKAYWGVDEIHYGSSNMVLPYPFGVPRAIAAWDVIESLRNFDRWFADVYEGGSVDQILNFPEHDQDEVDIIALSVKLQSEALSKIDSISGGPRTNKKPQTLMVSSNKPIGVVKTMYDPAQMRSLEYYVMVIQGLCSMWGVQPIHVVMATGKDSGTNKAMLQVKVNDNTVKENQNELEDHWDGVFAVFGITDYVIRFRDLQDKDELIDADVGHKKAMTVSTYRNAGIKANINEAGEIIFEGIFEDWVPGGRGVGETDGGKKISDTSDQPIKKTSTERKE